jgi:dephospho-CoA kinase
MLESCKVALTGPIAAGKSTALNFFKELGAYCVSADQIVHQLLSPDTDIGRSILHLLGKEVLINGEFSRALIAKRVFSDPLLLKEYESLLHPQVQQEIQLLFAQKASMYALLVAEIPLLFEAALDKGFDATIFLTADRGQRKERYAKGNPQKEEDFEKRETRLLPEKEKRKKATHTLNNSGSVEELHTNIKTLYQTLLRKKL